MTVSFKRKSIKDIKRAFLCSYLQFFSGLFTALQSELYQIKLSQHRWYYSESETDLTFHCKKLNRHLSRRLPTSLQLSFHTKILAIGPVLTKLYAILSGWSHIAFLAQFSAVNISRKVDFAFRDCIHIFGYCSQTTSPTWMYRISTESYWIKEQFEVLYITVAAFCEEQWWFKDDSWFVNYCLFWPISGLPADFSGKFRQNLQLQSLSNSIRGV